MLCRAIRAESSEENARALPSPVEPRKLCDSRGNVSWPSNGPTDELGATACFDLAAQTAELVAHADYAWDTMLETPNLGVTRSTGAAREHPFDAATERESFVIPAQREPMPALQRENLSSERVRAAAVLERWFHIPRPLGKKRGRIVWLPHAGGSATVVHHWPKHLSEDVELAAVQLPGRSYRLGEPPYRRIEALLLALEPVLCELCTDLPYVLFGHSMGALVAYELAERLRRSGRPLPAALVVSGRRAPHLPSIRPAVHDASDRVFIAALEEYQGMPQRVLRDPDMLAMVLPALRADFELMEHHVPVQYEPLAIPIIACGGECDPTAS